MTALIAAIIEIASILISLAEILGMLVVILGIVELLFDPKGKQRVGQFVYNIVAGALDFAGVAANDLAGLLSPVASAFLQAVQTHGGTIASELTGPLGELAKATLEAQRAALTASGTSEPENAIARAAVAFQAAFGAGLSSAATAAAFEAILPEKLNVLNGVSPLIAKFAGVLPAAAPPAACNAASKPLRT